MSYFFIVGTTLTTQQYVLAWKQWQEMATTELHQKIPSSPLSHCALPSKKSKLPEFPNSKSEYFKKNSLLFSRQLFLFKACTEEKQVVIAKIHPKYFFLFKLWKHVLLCAQKFNWCCWSILKIKIHLQCWSGTPKNKPPWNLLGCYWYLFIIGRWSAFDFFGSCFLLINPAFKARKITQMLL